eukprot:TRINITY_DN2601_c0_g1_i1.p1 TRINITY_DN2601_c0_g1~~TRINITY_DN2601_c0_g1_i1.p1  ORF type:complete len:132 (+),score=24.09 TRINITY_DN2601_c0_g1_i1:217-612(+)
MFPEMVKKAQTGNVGLNDPEFRAMWSENPVLISPIAHKPITDWMKIQFILSNIVDVVKGFHYTDIVPTPDGAVFIFKGNVTPKHEIEGIDWFRLNEEGKITELKVFLRPLNSTSVLAKEMQERLQAITQKL